MNIKDWKKFSDAVDKTNDNLVEFFIKNMKDIPVEFLRGFGIVEKTEVNYWEWKAGKLILNKNEKNTQ